MFSIDKFALRGGIALVCVAGLGGAALAETFVVRAGGPSSRAYPAGKALAANSTIALKAGDTLTILDSKGTRTLRGPGNYAAEGAGAKTNASFANLVSTKNKRRARTGAVRGSLATRPIPNSLWYVDVERSATICLPAAAPVALWRPKTDAAQSLTLRNDATGSTAPVAFRTSEATAAWPAGMATSEGASYSLSGSGLPAPVKVRFTGFVANLDDAAGTAAALSSKGCQMQLEVLIANMEARQADAASASASF